MYAIDYVAWTEEQIKLLQQKDLENLDIEHLIEELEALGSEQRHKVESYLYQLLIHLLLYQYWQVERDRCQEGWKDEIDIFRLQLQQLVESKTLYNHMIKVCDRFYEKARKKAIKKTKLNPDIFPFQCPYSFEAILDDDWLPTIKEE